MLTATHFIKRVKQPRGGYFKQHQEYQFPDSEFISPKSEHIMATTMGTVVDYLARFFFFKDAPIDTIMEPVVLGAKLCDANMPHSHLGKDIVIKLKNVQRNINQDLLDTFVKASFLSDYYRRGAMSSLEQLKAYHGTSDNDYLHIMELVDRSWNFLNVLHKHSHALFTNFVVASDTERTIWGDGDLRTDNTIADFKVYSKNAWNTFTSAQLATYYLLGRYGVDLSPNESRNCNWEQIQTLAIFDVRYNRIEYMNIKDCQKSLNALMQHIKEQIKLEKEHKNDTELSLF